MGINFPNSFTRTTNLPLDEYYKVADLTERDAIPVKYQGQLCYVTSENKLYILLNVNSSTWQELNFGSVSYISLTDTSDTGYSGKAGFIPFVNSGQNGLELKALRFESCVDVPLFNGNAGKYLRVNSAQNALEYNDVVTNFLSLTDTPSSYTGHNGKFVRISGTQLVFENIGFTTLQNVPSSYSGQTGKLVAVNSAETGLEFIPNTGMDYADYATNLAQAFIFNIL